MTSSTKPKHSLEITDRGGQHRHRWLPVCSCGHPFIPLRTRSSAEDSYHAHVAKEEREAKRATIGRTKRSTAARAGRRTRVAQQPGPKPLTPVDQLPPELRPHPD